MPESEVSLLKMQIEGYIMYGNPVQHKTKKLTWKKGDNVGMLTKCHSVKPCYSCSVSRF